MAVHYDGRFPEGNQFDSSYKRERPFVFEIGNGKVIRCWDEAFAHLSKGMKARLYCPSEYAYGSGGAGRIIPPDADLVFDVELIDINPIEKPPEEVAKPQKRKRKNSWSDLPPVGDDSTHQCFTPVVFYASFSVFMLAFGYFLYAICMPVEAMTRGQRQQIKKEAKKISEGKIA